MQKTDAHVLAVNGGGGRAADVWSRGTKRNASDSNLSDFERFEKRLRLLSIRSSDKKRDGKQPTTTLHTPVSNNTTPPPPTPTPDDGPSSQAPRAHTQPNDDDELMQIDPTPTRVYIHDLDAELADAESPSSDEKLIFLPDIEAHLSKLPRQVLHGDREDDDPDGQELVLYSVPKSLTVDDERNDSVRKAIIEARQRARERAVEEARERDMERKYDHSGYDAVAETAHGYNTGYNLMDERQEEDFDAMDIG